MGVYGFATITTKSKRLPETSLMNFRRNVNYGLGVLLISVRFRFQKIKLGQF
jgi:hypothetical protein